jgi:hypothetical protein
MEPEVEPETLILTGQRGEVLVGEMDGLEVNAYSDYTFMDSTLWLYVSGVIESWPEFEGNICATVNGINACADQLYNEGKSLTGFFIPITTNFYENYEWTLTIQ